jgi:heterodisulfide reductase subunit B2
MKCLYYPGCSQKASSISYEKSFLAIAKKLGIEIIELEDWNCCGTTVTISVNEILAMTLSARNLAIAEPLDLPLVAPCPSCYITLSKVNKLFKDKSSFVSKINDALGKGGLNYKGKVEVCSILDFLANKVGTEKIKEKVVSPLKGLRVAPYYGCQLVTPYATGDDVNNPQNLEKIIEALGGTPVDFTHKTQCCGGSMMITKKPQAEEMSTGILKSIDKAGADMVVTPCGLCQINLDFAKGVSSHYLGKKISLPVMNVTQMIGMALGVSKSVLKENVSNIKKHVATEQVN